MGEYLPAAVSSVLDQTWENLEIVVVDDGSTDDTVQRMERFRDVPKVRYLRMANQGQPFAKNKGLREAQGKFIAFCDADDLWMPQKLNVQMKYFDDPEVGVVYSDVAYVGQNGQSLSKRQPYKQHSGKITDHLIIKNFIPFGTAVFRRECIEKNGYFDEQLPMGIDWDLWLRYSIDWKFQHVPEVTYIYRIWPGQMSKDYRGRYINAFHILKKFLDNYPHALPERVKSKAWADMYISRGLAVARSEQSFIEPLNDVVIGLRKDLLYIPGWKALVKLILRRV
ncbi:MAG: glycosyltransferase [Marinobacter sp.]|nr:glycosyltransferase [Marinobacter sp.]